MQSSLPDPGEKGEASHRTCKKVSPLAPGPGEVYRPVGTIDKHVNTMGKRKRAIKRMISKEREEDFGHAFHGLYVK